MSHLSFYRLYHGIQQSYEKFSTNSVSFEVSAVKSSHFTCIKEIRNISGVKHITPELHTIPYGLNPARVISVKLYVVGYCFPNMVVSRDYQGKVLLSLTSDSQYCLHPCFCPQVCRQYQEIRLEVFIIDYIARIRSNAWLFVSIK